MHETIDIMIKKAVKALANSYSPYSQFRVASCIQTENNQFFTGVNIENAAYSMTICAERAAIAQMISSGEKKIQNIVILSDNALCPPCGACRQCIFEFSTAETRIHLCDKQKVVQSYTIKDLLPLAFSLTPNIQDLKHDD